MANSEHLAILKEGVAVWNGWRKANRAATWNDWNEAYPEIVPDLTEADLSGADLRGASLRKARLDGVNFSHAKLSRANLSRAKLRGAKLSGTSLIGAILGVADLTNADLRNANLSNANAVGARLDSANLTSVNLFHADLGSADLTSADFTRAHVAGTIFANNDLSRAIGLETVVHLGPSTIGIDTIYRSQGKIPLTFLRGAGVPDNFIEYMGSLTGKALEFYSCFISYSTKDQEFADRLYADLQNKGVRCWFAPHDVQGGKKLHEQIDAAIRMHERLLLILSPNSMDSEWVRTEIRKARKRERTEKKRVLFPVRMVPFDAIRDWELFDADEGKDLAVEIREYYIPDFSNWKSHDSYAKEFNNLLRDLKSEAPKGA